VQFWCSNTKRNTSNSSTQNSVFVHLLEIHAVTKLGVMLTCIHHRSKHSTLPPPSKHGSWHGVVNKIPVLPTATREMLRSNGSARKHCGTNSWRRMIALFPSPARPSKQRVATVSNGQRMWRDNFQNGLEITTPRSIRLYTYYYYRHHLNLRYQSVRLLRPQRMYKSCSSLPYYAVQINISKNVDWNVSWLLQ